LQARLFKREAASLLISDFHLQMALCNCGASRRRREKYSAAQGQKLNFCPTCFLDSPIVFLDTALPAIYTYHIVFWNSAFLGDSPDAQARSSLRTSLAVIRKSNGLGRKVQNEKLLGNIKSISKTEGVKSEKINSGVDRRSARRPSARLQFRSIAQSIRHHHIVLARNRDTDLSAGIANNRTRSRNDCQSRGNIGTQPRGDCDERSRGIRWL
jgi:hypothetical protein